MFVFFFLLNLGSFYLREVSHTPNHKKEVVEHKNKHKKKKGREGGAYKKRKKKNRWSKKPKNNHRSKFSDIFYFFKGGIFFATY